MRKTQALGGSRVWRGKLISPLQIMLVVAALGVLAGCNMGVPQATPTVAPTRTLAAPTPTEVVGTPVALLTLTETPTLTVTQTATGTGTQTAQPSATDSATFTPTDTPDTPGATATVTPSPTNTTQATETTSRTPSNTPPASATQTLPPSATDTATETATATDTPTRTLTPTNTATNLPTATDTFTVTPSDTATATVVPSDTPSPTPSDTPVPPTETRTPTDTPRPTVTPLPLIPRTPLPTQAPSDTPSPSATFTDLPTNTATNTPTETLTPGNTPQPPSSTATITLTATDTPAPTNTDTATPLPPTETPTDAPPSPTPFPTSTDTAVPTTPPTATDTALPTAIPTDVPTAIPTAIPTITATFTPPPTATVTLPLEPTLTFVSAQLTVIAQRTAIGQQTQNAIIGLTQLGVTRTRQTAEAFGTQISGTLSARATATQAADLAATQLALVPTSAPPPTVEVAELPPTLDPLLAQLPTAGGTIDATPVFATPDSPDVLPIVTVATTPIGALTPTFAPLGVRPEDTPAQAVASPLPPTDEGFTGTLVAVDGGVPGVIAPPNPGLRGYALSTERGGFAGTDLGTGGAARFSINPVTGVVARADVGGLLYVGNARLSTSPFSEFTPASPEENNARTTQLAWSPDGGGLVFVVDSANDNANDGVWLYSTSTGTAVQLFYDCQRPPDEPCNTDRSAGPFQFRTREVAWNYSSTAVLVQVDVVDEGRGAFHVVRPGATDPATIHPICRYDYASWGSARGNVDTLITSGRGLDGRVGIFRVQDPSNAQAVPGNCQPIETLLDGSATGLWVQNAVERLNGEVFALGSSGGQGSAQTLYRIAGGQAQAVTQTPIGNAAPERVDWSPDRTAVLLVVPENGGRRYYIATIVGGVQEITGEVADALAVEWVRQLP